MHQLAEIESINYPKASEVVCNSFYMHDLLTGGNSKPEVMELKQKLTKLLEKEGFKVHKWKTNVSTSREDARSINESVDISNEKESKLLGI